MNIEIKEDEIIMVLTQAKSKIRLADGNGNHISKPTEGKNIKTNFIEWMITNIQINELIKHFLNNGEKKKLIKELGRIKVFIRGSKYATREAVKPTTEKLDKFADFEIYKYTETFYSFEKEIVSKIKIRITFKMGDYTLAPFMFVLIPFEHSSLKLKNLKGFVKENEFLGSKCKGIWKPKKEDVIEIIKSLSCASDRHRDDLIEILKSQL